MTFPVKIVVRRKGHKYHAGFASKYPLHTYHHVKDFGTWYGSQMPYAPYKEAMKKAKKYARIKNSEY